jgi:abhydrolase domain-containing protein 6
MNTLVWLLLGLAVAAMLLLVASRLLPTPFARLLLALERRACGFASCRQQVGDIDWHYLDGGRGETLVLLHGFNADAHHFVRVGRFLRKRFRILAPDLPGFGQTRYPGELSFDIDAQATRVLDWLDALGIERCYLGGNSMGGYVAAAIARLAPERITALWLLAPGGLQDAPYAELFQEVAAGRHNPLVVRDQADFERLVDMCFVRRPWMPHPIRAYLAKRAAAGCERALGIFAALRFNSPPLESFAAEISTPTLIVWGDHDRVLHPGRSGAARFAHAE